MLTPYNRMTEYFRDHPEELPKPQSGFQSCTVITGTPFDSFGIIVTPEGTFDLEGNPIDVDYDENDPPFV